MENEFKITGNVVCITLRDGQQTLIDVEDLPKAMSIGANKWYMGEDGYIKGGNPVKLLHRIIMDTPKGLVVDHKNHLKWDNRKENLINCTRSENSKNQLPYDELITIGAKKEPEPVEALMTNQDVMEFLKINERTLYEYRKQGMPFIKLTARTFRYEKEAVMKWLKDQNREGQGVE